eukprot:COSAG01_NODE_7143_length_3332_cov_6.310238_3_plen_263_part_00
MVIADLPSQAGKAAVLTRPHGKAAVFVPTDTRSVEDLERLGTVAQGLGRLSCWFNNAGFAQPGDDIASMRERGLSPALRNMIEVNTLAHINGSGVAMRAFGKDGGVVVSTASMAGLLPLGAPPVYSASKAAVVHFTRAMGLTLGEESNLRFYCLCPSYTATSQGPAVEEIQASVGGVLRAEHMGEGFIMLVTSRPPNGAALLSVIPPSSSPPTTVHSTGRYDPQSPIACRLDTEGGRYTRYTRARRVHHAGDCSAARHFGCP